MGPIRQEYKEVLMKIFIDSADLDEIQQGYAWGVLDGVTTNPSLLKQAVDRRIKKGEKLDLKEYISRILQVAKGTPVSLEVTEFTYGGMIAQAKRLFQLFNPVAGNVYIKIPVNPAFKSEDTTHFDGIRAIRELTDAGIPVNTTLDLHPRAGVDRRKGRGEVPQPFCRSN